MNAGPSACWGMVVIVPSAPYGEAPSLRVGGSGDANRHDMRRAGNGQEGEFELIRQEVEMLGHAALRF